jgi:hypothetical protein
MNSREWIGSNPDVQSTEHPSGDARTFLHALHGAILHPASATFAPVLLNGISYNLHARKRLDASMGSRLAASGLVRSAQCVMRLHGERSNSRDRSRSDFQLWFETGSHPVLPLRFEFGAARFCISPLSAIPSLAAPAFIPLFPQENT